MKKCNFKVIKLLVSFGAKLDSTAYHNSVITQQTCKDEIIHFLLDSIPEEKGVIQGEKGDELCYNMDSRNPKKVIIFNWRNNKRLSYEIDSEMYNIFRKDIFFEVKYHSNKRITVRPRNPKTCQILLKNMTSIEVIAMRWYYLKYPRFSKKIHPSRPA